MEISDILFITVDVATIEVAKLYVDTKGQGSSLGKPHPAPQICDDQKLIACGISMATYNEGATDFKETPAYKESIQSRELLEEPDVSN
ncbi:hypothetical protein EPI10_016194 [Gossypium australe]|uniref:Uncharacterized protein n=1 Tax=Gossypium australe TaxID=47621 RepID=A0A5B6VN72_9ROSI|nr:hypothetical protein EPI10_016194 [Gossypium australe]